MDASRRALLKGLGVGGIAAGVASSTWLANMPTASAAPDDAVQNILSAAVAWRETAAERDMLYRQGFNIARDRLDHVLRGRGQRHRGHKRLAFISDVDDTVLSSDTYWRRLIAAGKQAFDDAMWDDWVRENGPTATPGAVEFTQYAKRRGVEIFYISSRDQGDDTQALGVGNLKHVGLAYADNAHATFFRGSSNKEPAQQAIAAKYEVIAYLGDNLNDFRRKYYSTSVAQRKALANEDAEEFGRKFILFPNNTDGHWMRAIFGDSEPPDSPAYRAQMLQAAMGLVP